MNTTVIHHGGAIEHHFHLRAPAPSDARGRGSNEPAPSACNSFQRTVAALGAVALVAALGAFPSAAEAVTCTAGKRGTLNDNNTFTEGTTDSDLDYRIVCTGDADGRRVTGDDLDDAIDHADADSLDDVDYLDEFVLELSNAYWRHYDDEVGENPTVVVLGNVQGDSGSDGVRFFGDGMDFWNDWNVESHATIRTTGGGAGLTVGVGTDPHYYALRVRNFGLIETRGGGSSDGDRRGRGMNITSDGGDAVAINESGGSVTTRGPGARGVTAGAAAGSATAINHGTITTYGGGFIRRGSLQTSGALHTWADAHGAVAQSVNESGGVIETNGDGAPGVAASTWKGGGTIAIATNRGQVTTRGDRLHLDGRTGTADGVRALVGNGLARATNETDATVETEGKGSVGLWAGTFDRAVPSVGGRRAEVENRGTITTSGDESTDNARSHGMQASSRYGSSYAANHEGATVTTSGRAARGVMASNANGGYGAPDESAYALNHGTIETTGDGFHSDSAIYSADGLAAFSGGDSPAVVVNALEGKIETTGTGARGVVAHVYRKGGAASATNRGSITTRGDAYRADREGTDNDAYQRADGMIAISSGSDAAVANEVGGVIETHGAVAMGTVAVSEGGSAVAVNRGRVTTHGEAADDLPGEVADTSRGSTGVHAHSHILNAYAENGLTGRIDTHGDRAFALYALSYADGSRTSAIAEVVNRGQAHTRGHNADGVVAIIPSGTADHPNYARATNAAGASITTAGAGSSGLTAGIYVIGGTATDGHGIAIARNDGTVVTGHIEEGDEDPSDEEMAAGVGASNGVVAAFWSPDGTTINNAGDVAVVNTGDVTVKRENASGIYAETFGTGKVAVRVVGGSVSAEGENGRGLWARAGTTGAIEAIIAESSEIVADSGDGVAAEFDAGVTDVRLLDSSLVGAVDFGSGTDTFTVRDGRVTGAIDFGDGADALNVHGDSWLEGAISNLESLSKRGAGNLVLRDDADFSAGASATIESGGLVFTGQFDLGSTGTMRIHDAARLTAVLADPDNPPRITAGGGINPTSTVTPFILADFGRERVAACV